MKDIVKAFDSLPLWAKIVLALPFLDIAWAIYRICRSAVKKSVLGIVLGVVMIFLDAVAFWIIDIITLLLIGKVIWIH